jgi:phage tail-like protein
MRHARLLTSLLATLLATPLLLPGSAARASSTAPISPLSFVVSTQTQQYGTFRKLAGLEMNVNNTDYIYSSVGGKVVSKKEPGSTTQPQVTLSRPMSGVRLLRLWHRQVLKSPMSSHRDLTISAVKSDGTAVLSWKLLNAWPTRITLPGLNSATGARTPASVTFVAEKIMIDP